MEQPTFKSPLPMTEAEIRADEREKAAQRVTNEFVSEGPVAVTHPVVQRAIAAARGGDRT